MKRIMLVVAYDGTDFHGWQYQPGCRTVEGELNEKISRLIKEEVSVIGCSRTDSGVHALGNVAVFDTKSTIPADRYASALNTMLSADVKIASSQEVDTTFHPRRCVSKKRYEYTLYQAPQPNPLKNRYEYYVNWKLDIAKMRCAAKYLIGEHDFKSFASVHTQAESTIRTIYDIQIIEKDESLVIAVEGNGFLYNMVRIIAGTLIEVGKGRWEPKDVHNMLESTDRTVAGPTAPACGLKLCYIQFE